MTGFLREEFLNKNTRILYASTDEYERAGNEKLKQIEEYGTSVKLSMK